MSGPQKYPDVSRLSAWFMTLTLMGCSSGPAPVDSLPSDASPGTFLLGLEHDGEDRQAVVYVPESYDLQTPPPLLLNFHGFGGTAQDHMEWADLRPLSDEHGFVLVYPQGTNLNGSPHWNTSLPSADNKSSADDFGFIEVLLDTIAATYPLDSDRVYAAGYSNGGMFSFALACFRSDRVAAVGSVSGTMLDDVGTDCTPPPTSIITLNGTEDSVLAYEGGEDTGLSAQAVIDYWLTVNGIDDPPLTSTASSGGYQVESFQYTDGVGGTEVAHYRIEGGEHVWFDISVDGEPTNELLWNYLSRFNNDGAL